MKYSQSGLQLTERFEGCRLVAYQDQVGVWTIGFGHTRGVYAGMTCTQAQAEQWLQEDTAICEQNVNQHVRISITQSEFDALCDFSFNLGCAALDGSSLLRLLNTGNFAGAAKAFEQWDHAGGKVVAGLLRRRLAEEAEFVEVTHAIV
jgi:lysozyme